MIETDFKSIELVILSIFKSDVSLSFKTKICLFDHPSTLLELIMKDALLELFLKTLVFI